MIARAEFFPLLRAFALALAVHVLMVLLVVLGTFNWQPFRQPQPVGLTIEAVIVDTGAIRERREQAQRAAAEAEQRQQAQERRAQELEKQRQREKEAQVQRQQKLEEQRKKEAQDRLAALRLERERKLEEERQQQQRELEQARQQAEAAEKKRQLDAERLKQLEARKQTEAAEQRRKIEEAERQKQAAERALKEGQQETKRLNYSSAIQAMVTQNWLRPPTAQAGLRCTLKIVQIPGGEVISAAIAGNCNGDEATRRSIVAAVERAGSLPYRGFEDVFERAINFIFKYDGE